MVCAWMRGPMISCGWVRLGRREFRCKVAQIGSKLWMIIGDIDKEWSLIPTLNNDSLTCDVTHRPRQAVKLAKKWETIARETNTLNRQKSSGDATTWALAKLGWNFQNLIAYFTFLSQTFELRLWKFETEKKKSEKNSATSWNITRYNRNGQLADKAERQEIGHEKVASDVSLSSTYELYLVVSCRLSVTPEWENLRSFFLRLSSHFVHMFHTHIARDSFPSSLWGGGAPILFPSSSSTSYLWVSLVCL